MIQRPAFNIYFSSVSIKRHYANHAKSYSSSVGLSGYCVRHTIIAQAKTLRKQNPNYSRDEVLSNFQYQ